MSESPDPAAVLRKKYAEMVNADADRLFKRKMMRSVSDFWQANSAWAIARDMNLEFLASARSCLPAILDELDRLRAEHKEKPHE